MRRELDEFPTGAGRWFVASVRVQVRVDSDTDAPRSVVTLAEKTEKFGWCPRLVAVV